MNYMEKIELEKRIDQLEKDNEGWKMVKHSSLFIISSKPTNERTRILKSVVSIKNIDITHVYNFLMDHEARKKWDSVTINDKYLGKFCDVGDISYSEIPFPKPLKNRDCVFMRFYVKEENCFKIFGTSVSHKDAPIKKDIIRVKSHISGYICRKVNEKDVTLTLLTHSDPMGKLPSWIINLYAPKLFGEFIKKFLDQLKSYSKKLSEKNINTYMDVKIPSDTPEIDLNKVIFNDDELSQVVVDESFMEESQ